MDDCRLHRWDCTCLASLPSKVYKRSVSGQRKVLQTEVQQFLASCGSIIHQTHKALVSNSHLLTGIRLHKQRLQPFFAQKIHNLSRSLLRRDTANVSVKSLIPRYFAKERNAISRWLHVPGLFFRTTDNQSTKPDRLSLLRSINVIWCNGKSCCSSM